MNIPADVHWITEYIVLFGIADLGILSRMMRKEVCFTPDPSPFPHVLRSKRLWQPWSRNNWKTSKYFTSLTEVMADSLSSLCLHETKSYSALLLWKVLKILLPFPHFLLPLIHDTRDVICSHVPLTDCKVWNWLTLLFPRSSTTLSLPTLCRLSLIFPITWWSWVTHMLLRWCSLWIICMTMVQLHHSAKYCRAPQIHYCRQELNIHSKISGKNWWMGSTPSLAWKVIPKCYLLVWLNALMEYWESLWYLIHDLYYIYSAHLHVVQQWAHLDYHEEVPGDFGLTKPFNHALVFLCQNIFLVCMWLVLYVSDL